MSNQARFFETRQRILSAAVSVFSRKGYHETKVDEIVAESQTSKGSVYFHFPSKEKIFLALVDEITAKLEESLLNAVQSETDSVERVRAALRACLATFSRYRQLAKIVLVQSMGAGSLFAEKRQEVYGRFSNIIQLYLQQGMADGDLPQMDAEIVAIAWLGAINEIVVRWVNNGEPDLQRALPALEATLLRSIGVKESKLVQIASSAARPLLPESEPEPADVPSAELVDAQPMASAPAPLPQVWLRAVGDARAIGGWRYWLLQRLGLLQKVPVKFALRLSQLADSLPEVETAQFWLVEVQPNK